MRWVGVVLYGWLPEGCVPPQTGTEERSLDPSRIDADGDGWIRAADCDDTDPLVGGPEIPLDGIDNDCNGVQGLLGDADGDGLALTDDCDDTDASVGAVGAAGVPGVWEGDATAADVAGFCEAFCRRYLTGSLVIEDSALTDLDALGCVSHIAGDLVIGGVGLDGARGSAHRGNAALRSLDGLAHLSAVGGDLVIEGNDALTSLAGLGSLASVGGDLSVSYQIGLSALSGLERLAFVRGDVFLYDDDGLETLSGLGGLVSIGGGLAIGESVALRDVTALYPLARVGGNVAIFGNQLLTDEAAWRLANEIDVIGGTVTIAGN